MAYDEVTGTVGVYPATAVMVHYDPKIAELIIDETIATILSTFSTLRASLDTPVEDMKDQPPSSGGGVNTLSERM